MKTYWELKEELKEKYTDKQRMMRDMGRNQSPGASASKISSTAGNVVKHMGGAAVMPRDLARRKHAGAGMETDGPAPGHAAARGVKKVRGAKTTQKVKEDASSDAVKAYMAKGGKVTKLPPGKAAGYHGKDDPGKDMRGMMDKDDTKGLPRKKVKSMGAK